MMIDLIVMGTQFSVITIYEFHTPCRYDLCSTAAPFRSHVMASCSIVTGFWRGKKNKKERRISSKPKISSGVA
jgi:hypothetical protein